MSENRSVITLAHLTKEKIEYLLQMDAEFEKNTNRKIIDGKVVEKKFFEK